MLIALLKYAPKTIELAAQITREEMERNGQEAPTLGATVDYHPISEIYEDEHEEIEDAEYEDIEDMDPPRREEAEQPPEHSLPEDTPPPEAEPVQADPVTPAASPQQTKWL